MRRGRDTTNPQHLGERVRLARIEQNLSQEGLATLMPEFTRAGKTTARTNSWVSNIESGKNEPSIADVVHLASILKVGAGWLVNGERSGDSEFLGRLRGMEPLMDESGQRTVLATAEQQVRDAEEARRALEQRPERLQALIAPDSTPQDKKAVLQRYLSRVVVFPGDPEPRIEA